MFSAAFFLFSNAGSNESDFKTIYSVKGIAFQSMEFNFIGSPVDGECLNNLRSAPKHHQKNYRYRRAPLRCNNFHSNG